MDLYSWQQNDWQQISREFSSIPNAWLITGDSGIGKTNFAMVLAQSLLCKSPRQDGLFCNKCQSCLWFAGKSHPDFLHVTDDFGDINLKTGARKLPIIKVDAIRELINFAQCSAIDGGRKLIIIEPAEAMNIQASNALLKVLEEPLPNKIFILVSSKRDRLLPTIKSRCRQYRLKSPSKQQALDYLIQQGVENAESLLAFHGGSPLFDNDSDLNLLRQEFIQVLKQPRLMSILQLAEQIEKKKLSLSLPLIWLSKWLIDLVSLSLSGIIRYHPEEQEVLRALVSSVEIKDVFFYHDKIKLLMPFSHHTLNVRLQIEALLIEYLRLFGK